MKILFIIDYLVHAGGGFSYALAMSRIIQTSSSRHQILFAGTNREINDALRKIGCRVIDDLTPFRRKIARFTSLVSPIDQVVRKHSVDIVHFLSPSSLALRLTCVPYIFTVWDFCHRDWPEFPEVSGAGEFDSREYLYRKVLSRALAVIVDSEDLAQKTTHYYTVNADRIMVVPFVVPAPDLKNLPAKEEMFSKYPLKDPFVFYPAQFWPHKNHVYILRALSMLSKRNGKKVDAVFCGNDFGSLSRVKSVANELSISGQIHFPGFVPREDVWGFYLHTLALVMPTYFGPTNIPPLEALAVGCPLVYSDLPSFRREYAGIARFVDLNDPSSLSGILNEALADTDAWRRVDAARVVEFKRSHSADVVTGKLSDLWDRCDRMLALWH